MVDKLRTAVAYTTLVMGTATLLFAAMTALYAAKSAAGINLFEGHFFLSETIYPLVRPSA